MKIITYSLLLLFIVLLHSNVYSQTERGRFFVSGTGSFKIAFPQDNKYVSVSDYYEMKDFNKLNINFTPQFGYFLVDNLAVGVSSPISFYRITLKENNSQADEFIFIIGPTLRYYFGKKEIRPYLKASYGLGRLNINEDTGYYPDISYNPYGYSPNNPYGYNGYGYGGGYSPYHYSYVGSQYSYNYDANTSEKKQNIDYFEIAGGIAFFISEKISLDVGISYQKMFTPDWIKIREFSSSIGVSFFFGNLDRKKDSENQVAD